MFGSHCSSAEKPLFGQLFHRGSTFFAKTLATKQVPPRDIVDHERSNDFGG